MKRRKEPTVAEIVESLITEGLVERYQRDDGTWMIRRTSRPRPLRLMAPGVVDPRRN